MRKSHRVAVKSLMLRVVPVAVLVSAVFSSAANAMTFGHSRLLSPTGQPLRIQVPVYQLSPQEAKSLSVSVAPAAAWQQASLEPPVDPSTMQVAVVDGYQPGSRIITISSNQVLSSNVADLLLSVRSSSGRVQHQVSMLAPADLTVARASGGINAAANVQGGSEGAAGQAIHVRSGDTLFALARANAVSGVSIYQWMIAVQRANPKAFIQSNVNLLKAGANLQVPGRSALTAISDAQARKLFQEQMQAFAQYRQRAAGQASTLSGARPDAGKVSAGGSSSPAPSDASKADRVVLASARSSDAASKTADDQAAQGKQSQDAKSRVAELEGNVKSLREALDHEPGSGVSSSSDKASASPAGSSGGAAAGSAAAGGPAMGAGQSSSSSSSTQASAAASSASANGASQPSDGGQAGQGSAATQRAAAANGTDSHSSSTTSQSSSAQERQSGSSGAASASQSGQSGSANGTSAVASPVADSAAPSGSSTPSNPSTSSKQSGSQAVSWLESNLLAVVTGALALVVLVVAWLLRRIGAERDDESDDAITEEMVRERLQNINLDLDETPKGAESTR